MAHAAALAIAETPAERYNPYFIYGGSGLGKTHLMHAIGHRIREKYPDMVIRCITSEDFANELIQSLQDKNPESFRQRYRNVDVLLVDDIQFLENKEHTQEEFFHTFNKLYQDHKQWYSLVTVLLRTSKTGRTPSFPLPRRYGNVHRATGFGDKNGDSP